jgi:hypothetical protein
MAQNKIQYTWWNELPTNEQKKLRDKYFIRQISEKAIKRMYKYENIK